MNGSQAYAFNSCKEDYHTFYFQILNQHFCITKQMTKARNVTCRLGFSWGIHSFSSMWSFPPSDAFYREPDLKFQVICNCVLM